MKTIIEIYIYIKVGKNHLYYILKREDSSVLK